MVTLLILQKEGTAIYGWSAESYVIIRPERTFLHCLIDLVKHAHNCSAKSFIRLNLEARSDILWWRTFIDSRNGLSMMHSYRRQNPDIVLTSDASGFCRCGVMASDFSTSGFTLPYSPLRHHCKSYFQLSLGPLFGEKTGKTSPFCVALTMRQLCTLLIQALAVIQQQWA